MDTGAGGIVGPGGEERGRVLQQARAHHGNSLHDSGGLHRLRRLRTRGVPPLWPGRAPLHPLHLPHPQVPPPALQHSICADMLKVLPPRAFLVGCMWHSRCRLQAAKCARGTACIVGLQGALLLPHTASYILGNSASLLVLLDRSTIFLVICFRGCCWDVLASQTLREALIPCHSMFMGRRNIPQSIHAKGFCEVTEVSRGVHCTG